MTNAEKYGVVAVDRARNLYATRLPGSALEIVSKGCLAVGHDLAHSDILLVEIDFSEVSPLEAGIIRTAFQARKNMMDLERSLGYDPIQRR